MTPLRSHSPSESATTLVQALDHIPPLVQPKTVGNSDDDLTPPPEEGVASESRSSILEADVEEFAAQVASPRKRRGAKKPYVEDRGSEEPADAVEPPLPPSGRRKRAPLKPGKKSEVLTEAVPVEEACQVAASPVKGRRKAPRGEDGLTDAATGVAKAIAGAGAQVDDGAEPVETPKKGRRRSAKKVIKDEGYEVYGESVAGGPVGDDDEMTTPKKRKAKAKTPKKSRIAQDEPEYDSEGNEIAKKKRRVKEYPKIEYEIPPVERKETTFRGECPSVRCSAICQGLQKWKQDADGVVGRLGYACLNTVLRSTKPDSIFCSRTCRIASIKEEGLELPKGLALMNTRDLIKMIEWNEQNKIRFMRLSSEMFPFASHAEYGYDLSFAAAELKEAGDLAKKYGHRLTMHPGQFTQLGSPKLNVVAASVRELNYQCEILDRMGLDQDSVMIIHMGGIYGDKESTLARFKENFTTRLEENVKARIVLENDEICYNVDDILPVCNELNIPIIFDYHHDWIYPSSEPPSVLIPKIAETWKKRGIRMKQHLSEPRPGAESVMERRAHADRCKALPPDLPDDVDLMIEAKDKEQAVFELYRIYGLEDVIHDNLRPPDANPSMQTKGRKSSTKRKTKDLGDADSDGSSVVLSEVEKEGDGEIGDEGVVGAREVESKGKAETKRAVRKAKKTAEAQGEEVREIAPDADAVTAAQDAGPPKASVTRGRKKTVNGKAAMIYGDDPVDGAAEEDDEGDTVKEEVEVAMSSKKRSRKSNGAPAVTAV